MTKVIKKIGMFFVWAFIIEALFLMIPFTVHFTESMLSGSSVYESINTAQEMVETKIMRPIDEWLEKNGGEKLYWEASFEDDLRRYEIPMTNWNVNWNSLNKGDP